MHSMLPYEYKVPNNELPPGPWHLEPSLVQFTSHGFPCVVLRTHSGHLCGYVGVPADNPYAQGHLNPETLKVHGGVTWSKLYDSKPGPQANDLFWIGFDCAHSGDFSPELDKRVPLGGTYRNIGYVTAECCALARQIAETKFTMPTQEYILSPLGYHKLTLLLEDPYHNTEETLREILTSHCKPRE